MKWTNEEVKNAINYINNGLTYNEISDKLNRTGRSVELKMNKLGYRNGKNKYYILNICQNPNCKKEFNSLKSLNRLYCTVDCSRITNKKSKNIKYCKNCGKKVNNIFCNTTCKSKYDEKIIFEKIRNNKFILENKEVESKWTKKYLIELYGNKCMKCGWDEINKVTNKVPIQLNHINGDSNNNNLNNVELLCPNCHSLTYNFGSLNLGRGREKRRNERIDKKIKLGTYKEKVPKKYYFCIECGKKLSEETKTKMCLECYKKSLIKIERPTHKQLIIDVKELGYRGTGRKYNVSDNSIRKWLNKYTQMSPS